MNADHSGKKAALARWGGRALYLLRIAWFTLLALLVLLAYGLYAGWSAPRQWSDGLFMTAFAQMAVAGVMILISPGEALDASTLRYVKGSDINETRYQLSLDTLRRKRFGLTTFFGGIVTMLLAAFVLWV